MAIASDRYCFSIYTKAGPDEMLAVWSLDATMYTKVLADFKQTGGCYDGAGFDTNKNEN